MTFPTIVNTATKAQTTNATLHKVTIPSGVQAGDLLLVFWERSGQAGTGTLDSKWTDVWNESVTGTFGCRVAYAIATGSESGDLDFTTITTDKSFSFCMLIRNWDSTQGVATSSTNSSGTANSNPPIVSPSWGSDDNLYITVSFSNPSGTTTTARPTGFTNIFTAPASIGNINASIDYLNETSSSKDPTTYTWSSVANSLARTLAIRGKLTARTPRYGYINFQSPGIA